jgi:hypothetical protein
VMRVFGHQFRGEPNRDRKLLVFDSAEAVYCHHQPFNTQATLSRGAPHC